MRISNKPKTRFAHPLGTRSRCKTYVSGRPFSDSSGSFFEVQDKELRCEAFLQELPLENPSFPTSSTILSSQPLDTPLSPAMRIFHHNSKLGLLPERVKDDGMNQHDS